MSKEYEEDRRYREWKDNPCDETLMRLCEAIKRHGRCVIVDVLHKKDESFVAELLFHAWKNLHVFDPNRGVSFFIWLDTCLRNKALDLLRDDPRRDEVSLDDAPSYLDAGMHDEETLQARAQVCALLRKLKGLNRRILVGKLRGMSDVEIADLCKLPLNVMQVRWHRLRKKLKNVSF